MKIDGRRARWESHRRARRAELVDATLVAIRRHGPGVGMDEVAMVAGTSKAVLYRHFADKAELYLAVCARVADTLVGQLRAALRPAAVPRDMVAAGINTYLQLIESDPRVYRFVVHPGIDRALPDAPDQPADPVTGLVQLIGDHVARVIEPKLVAVGVSAPVAAALALPWGHGLIGLVRAAADPWLAGRVALSRPELTEQLTELVWGGLASLIDPENA